MLARGGACARVLVRAWTERGVVDTPASRTMSTSLNISPRLMRDTASSPVSANSPVMPCLLSILPIVLRADLLSSTTSTCDVKAVGSIMRPCPLACWSVGVVEQLMGERVCGC